METQHLETAAKMTNVIASGLEPREIIHPATKTAWLQERTKDITSTEAPALFGLSPYMTAFELWHQKKAATVIEHSGNERTEWGKRLEASIAHGIADDNDWEIRPMTEYIRDPITRTGSSFDYAIDSIDKDGELLNTHGILEIKNVDALQFRDGWIVDGDNVEAPPHIEMQVQHQLMVSGRDYAYIGALVGGNRVVLIKRKRDTEVIEAILQRVAEFWVTIQSNTPPSPDFVKDADFIAKLYSNATPGSVMEADSGIVQLATQYKDWSVKEKDAAAQKKAAKAQLLIRMGSHEKVKADDFSISAGVVGSTQVSYKRDGYRTFRINWKRKK